MAKTKKNEFFEGILEGATQAAEMLESGKPLNYRDIEIPDPPAPLKPKDIVTLRTKTIGVSQHVFAVLLNVKPQTVQSWEQGLRTPSGCALRLLHIAQNKPRVLTDAIKIKVDASPISQGRARSPIGKQTTTR